MNSSVNLLKYESKITPTLKARFQTPTNTKPNHIDFDSNQIKQQEYLIEILFSKIFVILWKEPIHSILLNETKELLESQLGALTVAQRRGLKETKADFSNKIEIMPLILRNEEIKDLGKDGNNYGADQVCKIL